MYTDVCNVLLLTEKMDKIETLLYKVLIATESHDSGTCLPAEYFEKTKDCLNENDIMCTSIDLFANKAVCYNCSSCSDNTVVQCHRYGNLSEPLHVPYIKVDIERDGNISQLKMENIENNGEQIFLLSLPPCNCTWSQYNYTRILNMPHLQNYSSTGRPQLLRCQCDKDVNYDQLYCVWGDVCYKRNPKCSITATEINCTIVKYSEKAKKGNNTKQDEDKIETTELIIHGKCSQWETVQQSNCHIKTNFNDEDMELIRNLKAGEHLNLTDVSDITIDCPESNCNRPFNVICNKGFNISSCNDRPTTTTAPTVETTDDEEGKGNSYTTLLVIIIIVLLLLLLLYVGYQNHQKVNTITYIYCTMRITICICYEAIDFYPNICIVVMYCVLMETK